MNSPRAILTAILLGGLVAGTLDIGAAVLISGKDAGFICQVIASGLLGKAAYGGGAGSMVTGFLLQELMGLIIAAVYCLAATRLPVLTRQWIVGGLAYGVLVYGVMTYVVVPLSLASGHHMPKFRLDGTLKNGAAMLVFGLIVAWAAKARLGKTDG